MRVIALLDDNREITFSANSEPMLNETYLLETNEYKVTDKKKILVKNLDHFPNAEYYEQIIIKLKK